ncbi:MAG: hypothetical protein NZ518_11315, partial [Dehalococcoidia bacterium]|nr:hypothetical protein [Dehalococcoidia bacterium]
EGDNDPLLDEARQIARDKGRLSASYLQRHLRIGYNRAARLIDVLEDEGVLEPPDGRRAAAAGFGVYD